MNKQPANINRLDDYISSFYDDNIENRLKASKEILELFQDFNNLEVLIEHCNFSTNKRIFIASVESYFG